MQSKPCSALRPSRTVVTSYHPHRTAMGDTNMRDDMNTTNSYEQGDWVLCLERSDSSLACALSNGEVQVYDPSRLHRVTQFQAVTQCQDKDMVLDLNYASENLLVAAQRSGSLAVSDIRLQRPVLQAPPVGAAALESVSVGYNGVICAAGSSKGKVQFYDLRQQGKLLGSYNDSHSEVVTQVHFASPTSGTLLTGSEDGLACLFDTRQPSEELAVQSVLNVGTPIRRVGFCTGRQAQHPSQRQNDNTGARWMTVFCLTGSETASLWDVGSGCCLQRFGEGSLREQLGHTLTQSLSATSTPLTVDYLIDAHWDVDSSSLVMAVGNVAGEGALVRLSKDYPDQWQPCHWLRGGHRGVIRAWCPLSRTLTSPNHPVLSVSAGEDARLVEWNHHRDEQFLMSATSCGRATTPPRLGIRTGGPLRRQVKRHRVSTSPYSKSTR